MRSVDIDFDVFKALTAQLQSESDTYNAALRRLLGLTTSASPATTTSQKPEEKPWVSKGVMFDHETQFRANYKGQMYFAWAENGRLLVSNKGGKGASSSLSHAARLITNTSVDGWTFWEVKRPIDSVWRKASELRNGR